MIKKIQNYFLNDEIPERGRTLMMVLGYSAFVQLMAIPAYLYVGAQRDIFVVITISVLVMLGFSLFAAKTGKHDEASIGVCYFINMICIPLFYVYGGGARGGIEFLVVPGIIDAVLLMDGLLRKASIIIFSAWYAFLFLFTELRGDSSMRNVPEGRNIAFSMAFAMISSAMITVIIVLYQTSLLKQQKKRVEAALQVSRAGAQTKSRFLANMSHELRTPMNAILGMAELMDREDEKGAASEEIGVIRDTAASLLNTINDILTYSSLESEKHELISQQFSADRLIGNLIRETEKSAEEKGIIFQADVSPDIPNVLYGDDVKISRVLKNLLDIAIGATESGRVTFLIDAKRNREGTKAEVHARITDTGTGIGGEDLDNIYTSYETYDSRKDSRLKQLGLELTICRGILRMMNGNLDYKSLPDVGSVAELWFECFIVEREPIVDLLSLSISRVLVECGSEYRRQIWRKRLSPFKTIVDFAETDREFAACVENNRYAYIFLHDSRYEALKGYLTGDLFSRVYVVTDFRHSYGDFGKCRIIRLPITTLNLAEILCDRWNVQEYEEEEHQEEFEAPEARVIVVDDNQVNRLVAEGLLKRYRIKVDTAVNGMEAMGKIMGLEYDLVLLDQIMPGLDGFYVLQSIRQNANKRNLPVVCMTADSDEKAGERIMSAGFSDYLPKPIKERQLGEILLTFLPKEKIVRLGRKKETAAPEKMPESRMPERTAAPEKMPESRMPERTEERRMPERMPEKMPERTAEEARRDALEKTPGPEAGDGSEAKDILGNAVELDMKAGLAIVGGDESVYHLILNVYYTEGLEKLDLIPKTYASGDLKRFAVETHAVKGSSANIGAKGMSEMFRQLEMAGKAGDCAVIDGKLEPALQAFQELLEKIKQYLVEKNAFGETE